MSTRTPLDSMTRRWLYVATALLLLPLLLQLEPLVAVLVGAVALLSMGLSMRGKLPGLIRIALALILAAAVFSIYRRIGRDTGCALLAMMLALKPTETSDVRDARSLLAYGFFAPFASYLLDQGPLSLVLGAVGAATAMVVLLRLADLESGIDLIGWSPVGSLRAAGRLLLLGLPLVLATFWLFPRLPQPLWGLPERSIKQRGLSEQMTPDKWLDALTDDSAALRVSFDGPTPRPSQMYWRALTLPNFDGRTWKPGFPAPRAPDVEPGPVRWRYTLDMEPSEQTLLPLLDLPLAAPEGATLNRDGTLRTANPLISLTRWTATSALPLRFEPQLAAPDRAANLRLPPNNPRTLALGRQWRNEAGTNDDAIIRRALAMITEDFAYSLEVPLPGDNWIDDFLFSGKVGYCQQFSSAFVVLMRSAGIPARVVSGYVGGYRNPVGGYWIVRNSDAHAWAEVWLAGRGWTRVDPTAAVAPENIYDTVADRMPGGALAGIIDTRPMWNISDNLRRGWNDFVLGFNAERQAMLFRRVGIERVQPSTLIALFAVVAGLCLAGIAWWLSRGERIRDPLLRAWMRLSRRYGRVGLAREPHETASDWLARVQAQRPQSAAALAPLVQRFNARRYAAEATQDTALVRDLKRHRP